MLKDHHILKSTGSPLRLMLVFMLFFSLINTSFSQTEKNIEVKEKIEEQTQEEVIIVPKHKYFTKHNPSKAMWMSAALPGLGQY